MMLQELEVQRFGDPSLPVLLLIHDIVPVSPKAAFLASLSKSFHIVAPSAPGFGGSPMRPDHETMFDLINTYRCVMDELPAERIAVAGFGFGGWIAAELAVAGHRKLNRLVLVDAVGVKLGGREERDITHFFNTNPAELNRRSWHDPAARPDGVYTLGWQAIINDKMTDAEMVSLARNWDSLCLYSWTPHMFNPRLKDWLHRVKAPTLVVWGESDGIVTADYGRRYAALIPGAQFTPIAGAGHYPELEQPDAFTATVRRFLS